MGLTLAFTYDDWCYWLFHFITLFLVSTLTSYWDYDKIVARSQPSRDLEVLVLARKFSAYKLRDLGLMPERYCLACSVISMDGRVFPQAIMFHLTSN